MMTYRDLDNDLMKYTAFQTLVRPNSVAHTDFRQMLGISVVSFSGTFDYFSLQYEALHYMYVANLIFG